MRTLAKLVFAVFAFMAFTNAAMCNNHVLTKKGQPPARALILKNPTVIPRQPVTTKVTTSYTEGYNEHPAVMNKQIYSGANPATFRSASFTQLCLNGARDAEVKRLCKKASGKFIKGTCGVTQGSDSWGTYILARYQQFDKSRQNVLFCGKWYNLNTF